MQLAAHELHIRFSFDFLEAIAGYTGTTSIDTAAQLSSTWEAHNSPRAKPEGCGELPRSLVLFIEIAVPICAVVVFNVFHAIRAQ